MLCTDQLRTDQSLHTSPPLEERTLQHLHFSGRCLSSRTRGLGSCCIIVKSSIGPYVNCEPQGLLGRRSYAHLPVLPPSIVATCQGQIHAFDSQDLIDVYIPDVPETVIYRYPVPEPEPEEGTGEEGVSESESEDSVGSASLTALASASAVPDPPLPPQRPPSPPTLIMSSPAAAPDKETLKLLLPLRYDGKTVIKCNRFLSQLRIYWLVNTSLTTIELKVQVALSLLDGDARAWATPYFAQLALVQVGVQGVTTPFANEAAFAAAFRARFGNLDDEAAAQVELAKLCADKLVRKKRTAAEFSALFKGPADRSGYGDLELRDKYLSGIPSRVDMTYETLTPNLGFERHVAGAKRWSERSYKQGRLSLIFPIPLFLRRYLIALSPIPAASTMSARSATPASTPSLVNRRLASLLAVLEAPPTADAMLNVVEEWAQDLSPLVLAYRKALGAIRNEETELRVAAAVKQLAERASESWVEWARGDWPELATAIDAEKCLAKEEARCVEEATKHVKAAEERCLEDKRRQKNEEDRLRQAEDEHRAQEAADEELAWIAAAEGLLPDPTPAGVDKGKGRARVDEEVTELSDDPSVKTPHTVERPFAMTEADMAAAAIEKRQAGQKCDRCAGYRSAPVDCVWVENAMTCERCAQFQQGCYFDKVSVLGKTKKTRGGGSTTKKRIRPTSPGPSVADASGSKKRQVDEPLRPLLRLPLDGAGRLGLEQDDLDALDLDDESRGIIRVIHEERAHIARRRALLHDMDLDLQKMEKAALTKGGIGFVRGAVDDE
ncbi:hypothetical protein POSPLADRAFT_1155194 [Postia placenta MAD-698-R-SB12]|uniref:Uncharacterized protein n=1 Tax=Postia placenta MAD-698-R-SB12 TaxID=670580 RepID=A0A1X6MNS7_9APHY|nr:hypothetical protein POSPLADRAFT_1155194 [Postia placenta MAD-698-R-SB12]OSX58071.1 hypothetical protein POSPLADRAFT_1155194 [Postia placenta MAD-698-R-SB12]